MKSGFFVFLFCFTLVNVASAGEPETCSPRHPASCGGSLQDPTVFGQFAIRMRETSSLNKSFTVTGGIDPWGPTSATWAEQDAENIANTICAPEQATRLSGWIHHFLQYGQRWTATAEFECSTSDRDIREIVPAECASSLQAMMNTQSLYVEAQQKFGYALDICADAPRFEECVARYRQQVQNALAAANRTKAEYAACLKQNDQNSRFVKPTEY